MRAVPVRLTTAAGESYDLAIDDGVSEERSIRGLLNGDTFPGNARWALSTTGVHLNLAHVVTIEIVAEPEEPLIEGFRPS